MTCPHCQDVRWIPNHLKVSRGHGPCGFCNDNGQRTISDPDPSLKEIVDALPDGHAAKAQYDELVAAFTLQPVRAGRFIHVDMAKPGTDHTIIVKVASQAPRNPVG